MTATLLHPARIRDDLATDRARLAARLDQLSAELDGQRHGDLVDQSTFAISRDQNAGLIATSRERLTAIDRALERIDAGTYGICISCDELIAPERLEARPVTDRCVTCTMM